MALLYPSAGSAGSAGAPEALRPGSYESLMVAVAADGDVTGHFQEQLGSLPMRECRVLFAARGGSVLAWSPGDATSIHGRLVADGARVTLVLPGVRDLPGCASVLSPDAGEGLTFERTQDADWTALVLVSGPRASLYPTSEATRSRSYVVAGDVLGVSAQVGARLRITYVDAEGRHIRGWVDAARVRPIAPP